MYEAWRILKRNPFIYNPRSFAYIFMGFLGLGVYRQINAYYAFRFDDYAEDHPETHDERLRQYGREKNIHFREYVLAARAKLDAELRAEAEAYYQKKEAETGSQAEKAAEPEATEAAESD